jgi:hypothetical protein
MKQLIKRYSIILVVRLKNKEMKRINFGIVVIVAVLIGSCANNRSAERFEVSTVFAEEEIEASEQSEPPPPPETYISSSAALENPNDTTRKMIRTATIKFKVKNVIDATYDIENIIVKHDGFVENSDLTSQINRTKETTIKEDSILLTTYYTVINTLILRVPVTELDATLKEIAQLVDFMDYRIINAKDVTFDLLSKSLEQSRLARYDSRMINAIDNQGKRLNDVSDAENNLLRKQAQADEAKIASLQILDKIRFSTITLSLYQNQSIKYETIAKEKKVKEYSTPFTVRFTEALKFGWTVIVEFFLFITNAWSIILIAVLLLIGVNYYRKRKKSS